MPYSIRTAIPPGTTSGPELADIVEEVGDLTQIVVLSDTENQPGSPTEGDAYIVNGDVSWGGAQYDIAVFRDTTWIYHTPGEGWVAYIVDRGEARRFNGTDWNTRLPDSSPEHATDGGTDAYASATNTDAPKNGDTIRRDFQSANTTTTPTLDSLTITTKDGSALWEGALSGVHELQLASGGGSWLVLDPIRKAGPTVQTFTADGKWNRPAGCRRVVAEVVGGGGGGGNAQNDNTDSRTAGGGGGSGGRAKKMIDVSGISSSTVTIGSRGVGGSGTSPTNGASGEASSWDDGTNVMTGEGGEGGRGQSDASGENRSDRGGYPGIASGGDVNEDGFHGSMGVATDQRAIGGPGGGPGGGNGGLNASGGGSGETATTPGSGGGGGVQANSTGNSDGGDGGDGIVIVTEYY